MPKHKRRRGKHSSLGSDLQPVIRWLENLDCVRRVIPGRSASCRHKYRPGHLRIRQVDRKRNRISLCAYTGFGLRWPHVLVEPGTVDKVVAEIREKNK